MNLEDLVEIGSEEDVEGSIDQKILGELLQDVLDTLSAKDRELQQELVERGYAYEDTPAVQQVRFTAMGKGAIS